MRDKIEEKLEEWDRDFLKIDIEDKSPENLRIFYGMKQSSVELNDWNYIVFGLDSISKSGTNRQDLSSYLYVDIIRENYISDDTIFSLIDKIEELNGVKLTNNTCPIDYVIKGNTDIVCEMMRLTFTRPMKRMNING